MFCRVTPNKCELFWRFRCTDLQSRLYIQFHLKSVFKIVQLKILETGVRPGIIKENINISSFFAFPSINAKNHSGCSDHPESHSSRTTPGVAQFLGGFGNGGFLIKEGQLKTGSHILDQIEIERYTFICEIPTKFCTKKSSSGPFETSLRKSAQSAHTTQPAGRTVAIGGNCVFQLLVDG